MRPDSSRHTTFYDMVVVKKTLRWPIRKGKMADQSYFINIGTNITFWIIMICIQIQP